MLLYGSWLTATLAHLGALRHTHTHARMRSRTHVHTPSHTRRHATPVNRGYKNCIMCTPSCPSENIRWLIDSSGSVSAFKKLFFFLEIIECPSSDIISTRGARHLLRHRCARPAPACLIVSFRTCTSFLISPFLTPSAAALRLPRRTSRSRGHFLLCKLRM